MIFIRKTRYARIGYWFHSLVCQVPESLNPLDIVHKEEESLN
jgi:hypothetical protein